jgi:hypothetical protein
MRSAVLTIVAFLLAGALILTLWPRARAAISGAPPGQYPIDEPRFQWPASIRTAPYYPRKGMGSDTVAFTDGPEAKVSCALK